MPAAAFLDTGLAVARLQHHKTNNSTNAQQIQQQQQQLCLLDMQFLRALKLDVGATLLVSVSNNVVQFHARKGEGEWVLHATDTCHHRK
jgi:hypothetical protein